MEGVEYHYPPIRKQLDLREGDNLVWLVDQKRDLLLLVREEEAARLLSTHLEEKRGRNRPKTDG